MRSPLVTTIPVCHDQLSILSPKVSFSGYLLRKFKNCSGWQKLWVEFTHFCLFFYKSSDVCSQCFTSPLYLTPFAICAQDDFPLASLPVIGYTCSVPSDADNMSKNYVFKLQFKTHIYFFRAESDYAFNKWMEVIKMSTSEASLHEGTAASACNHLHQNDM